MIRTPPQHQTDPEKAPGVWRNPDTSFDRYPYMKHSTAEPTNNVKECCGNPFRTGPNGRGCDNCPSVKKMTFAEWWSLRPQNVYEDRPFEYMVDAAEAAWKAAQENV